MFQNVMINVKWAIKWKIISKDYKHLSLVWFLKAFNLCMEASSFLDSDVWFFEQINFVGPYSDEVEANENIQNVAHPTKQKIGGKRLRCELEVENASLKESQNKYIKLPKIEKHPCQSIDQYEVCWLFNWVTVFKDSYKQTLVIKIVGLTVFRQSPCSQLKMSRI